MGRVRRGGPLRVRRAAACSTPNARSARASTGGRPQPVGTIVVHVLLFDYRTLPFITSQNPYFEVFRPAEGGAPREGTTGSDVEVVIYGWALGPIYTSGPAAWPITDALFRRLYDPAAAAVLDHHAERDVRYARVLLERPRVHLRHRLPDADAVRSPRAPGGADHAVGRGLRPGAPRHGAVHARRARAAASRARAAPRDSRELLPEAVSGLRARVDHSGPGAGAVDSHVLRQPAHGRRRARGRADRRGRPAGHRAVECAPAAHRRAGAGERRRDGLDPAGHRSGRQHLRGREARRDERARPVRSPASSRQRTPDAVYRAIVAAAAAELRRRGSDRHLPLHDRGDARPRGRAEDDPHRPARQPSARHRSRDRRSRSRRPPRGARVRAARRRRWASTWPSASRIPSGA